MGKFSSTDIIRICNKYLSDDAITFDDVALSYGVSRSTITKNIYRGIVMGDVSIPIAEVGYSRSQAALVVAFCGKACVEGLL